MTRIHRGHLSTAVLPLLIAFAGGGVAACGSSHAQSQPAATAAAAQTPNATRSPAPATPSATERAAAGLVGQPGQPGGGDAANDEDEAELIVSRDVVGHCPKMRAVRQHVAEFDPDMVWLAVLESLAECMSKDGPMADTNIGVSGDEEHRHVVREVLQSRGVAPTRVIATPPATAAGQAAQGAAECQGGAECSKRVEITIAPGP
jgi:hypothetical protein